MKRYLFNLAVIGGWLLIGLGAHALAADVAIPKTPPVSYFGSAGWFAGLDSVAITSNANVSVPALGSSGTITEAAAGIGPVFGYHSGNASNFWEGECYAHWRNLGGSQVNIGAASSSQYDSGCKVKLGGTAVVATLGQALPNLGLQGVFPASSAVPQAPAATGQPNLPYFSVGFDARQVQASVIGMTAKGWQVAPTFGTGFMSVIMDPATGKPTGWITDTSIDYSPPGKGVTIGGDGTSNIGRVISAHFAIKRPL